MVDTAELREMYRDRAHLISLLTRHYPAHRETDPDPVHTTCAEVVVLDTAAGQVSWHVHRDDAHLFAHLPRLPRPMWDGHSTEAKHARIRAEVAERGVWRDCRACDLRDRAACRDALATLAAERHGMWELLKKQTRTARALRVQLAAAGGAA